MSNNQMPWWYILIPIIAAIIGGFFILYAALPQTPTTPVFSETSGGIDNDGIYEIRWEKSRRATSYILQEDIDPLFTSPRTVYTGSETKKVIYDKSDGDYYYRVRACNKAGDSEWSPTQKIGVLIFLPSTPTSIPSITPTPTPTKTPKLMPTPTPRTASTSSSSTKSTPTPIVTPTPTATPGPTPTSTPTPAPISTPTPTPTPTATPTPTPTPSIIVSMDNTSGWRTYRDDIGSSIHIESIPGRTDNAIEITFDLEMWGWVAISKRINPEILSGYNGLRFYYKGSGDPNTIELKLVYGDVGGTTFGAFWNRATVTDDWVSFEVPYSRFDCWWPEDNCLRYGNNLNLTKVRKIEFAISNKPEYGDVYGSGKVIIDDIQGNTS